MDVVLKTTGNYPYAEVLFSGKTGSRHIPLINSIPYVKDWLDHGHPHIHQIRLFPTYVDNLTIKKTTL